MTSESRALEHARAAAAFARSGLLGPAVEHYRRATALAPDRVEILDDYGSLLLRHGRLEEALLTFRRAYALDPTGYDRSLALSSLLRKEHPDEARQILNYAVARHPIAAGRPPDPQKPTILRARGLETSNYGILGRTDGSFTYLLRGGHFSIKHLLNKDAFNLVILNIMNGNLDAVSEDLDADLVLNTIGCADRERSSLEALARFLDRNPQLPVINDPRRILDTTRDGNYSRLKDISGVTFPNTLRVHWDGGSAEAIVTEALDLGLSFPMILREAGTQTGKGVTLVQGVQSFYDYFSGARANKDHYVIQFSDCQREHGFYNKIRIFCIDGEYHPVANVFRNSWSIHSGDRYDVMLGTPWMQESERCYLADPAGYLGSENYQALLRIRDLIDLDFFGIDFTTLDDGRLFIFELNAAMRHNFDHVPRFPYTWPYLRRISDAFETMVRARLRPH